MKNWELNFDEYVTGTVVTPCGWAYLTASETGVVACFWPLVEEDIEALRSHPDKVAAGCGPHIKLKQAAEALLAYFSGDYTSLQNVDVDSRKLSLWQRMVYYSVRSIPLGEVRSYKWVAAECGKPGGARAVGQALAVNPFPLFVPCHRVIHSDGRTGNFTSNGKIPGSILKKLLLHWEKGEECALEEMSRLIRENR